MQYNNQLEVELLQLCKLDKNPVLCTEPLEDTTYLSYPLLYREDGYYQLLHSKKHQFIYYLNDFIGKSVSNINTQPLIASVLSRILVSLKNIKGEFTSSDILSFWKHESNYHINNNQEISTSDWVMQKKQQHVREAYAFFYKMVSSPEIALHKKQCYERRG